MKAHLAASKLGSHLKVHKALREYASEFISEVVLLANPKYCSEVEGLLRPTPDIGWNMAVGGQKSATLGRPLSAEVKKKLSDNLIGKPLPKHMHEAALAANALRKPWDHYKAKANRAVWQMADRIYSFTLSNPSIGCVGAGKYFSISPSLMGNIIKKIRSGWNPLLDEDWLNFSSSRLTPETSGFKAFIQLSNIK